MENTGRCEEKGQISGQDLFPSKAGAQTALKHIQMSLMQETVQTHVGKYERVFTIFN